MQDLECFKKSLKMLQIELTEEQFKQFQDYYDMLMEWNKVMNLTAITNFEEVVHKHFIDSLSIIKVYELKKKKIKVIDLGTGAGLPGIPLKIVFPEINIVLLDSLNKRIKFLKEVIMHLNLNNICAVHGRAEDYGKKKEYREQFDLVVSRAVANLSTLAEYCIPFSKQNGYFIPYKSGKIYEETEHAKRAIEVLGGKIEKIVDFTLPNTEMERSFVLVKKYKETPACYPRCNGKPAKEPIR